MYYTPNMYNESYEDSPLIAPARGGGFTYSSLTFRSYSTFSAFLIFFFPALGALLFGYDIGSTSAVLIQLKSLTYSGVLWSHDVAESSFLQGAITSMVTLGALIGSIICFQVADSLGRRRSLLLASSLYLFGATLEVISGTPSFRANWGITVLIVGRLFYGFGCGFAMYGAPAYIAEMAPSLIRGKFF
jgi:MFS family permease